MFSYTVDNPNTLQIETDSFVVPFGHRCSSALACKYANLRSFSLPFDWTRTLFPAKIQRVLEENFEDFIPDVQNGIFKNKYDFDLAHFNPNHKNGVEEYTRRIERLRTVLADSKKKYFVFINEDYLYNNNYRQDEFNETLFQEMLNLETCLQEKYQGIDYVILYFDFKQHVIPVDSKILQIVLHSKRFYPTHDSSPVEGFRNFCGQVLAELFQTKLTLGYNSSVFYN